MLEIKNLNVRIGKKQLLHDMNLRLKPHTITALVGRNGCGKTTLVSCINQMQNYTGEILYRGNSLAGMPLSERSKLVGLLTQGLRYMRRWESLGILTQGLPAPHITVQELIKMGRNPYMDLGHHLTNKDKEAMEFGIQQMGVETFLQCYLDELSGGERQKAYMAMILAQDTRLLVLDEPTTHMDLSYERKFFTDLENLRKKQKKTFLIVTHNLNMAVEFADSIIIMESGHIVSHLSTKECLKNQLIEKYFDLKCYKTGRNVFFG